jgi:hypothetical protein
MKLAGFSLYVIAAGWLSAQPSKPQTQQEFERYVQSAEARMDARKGFPAADKAKEVRTVPANGANPHQVSGGQLYDWIGTVFIPGVSLEKLLHMLQDYDHRANYFPETIASSKLLCRDGNRLFRYTMRLKEPAVIDVDSEVLWDPVNDHRCHCRSYSTKTAEVGKDHGYLRQLYSYWWFAEGDNGVYVQAETITLSDEFGAMTRALGSMLMGINPEKSLKHSLASMRESVLKPGLEIPAPPQSMPACGAAGTR